MKSFEGKEVACAPPSNTTYFVICDITSISISDSKMFLGTVDISYTKEHTVNLNDYAMATFK